MKPKSRKFWIITSIVIFIVAVVGYTAWFKLFREEPLEVFNDEVERYKYGSIGGEYEAGIPYWIFVVLPRVFPEYLPGPGGYASMGLGWEQGKDLPIGFTKRTVGFLRVSQTCAVCHTASYREKPEDMPTYVAAAPGHTMDVQAFFSFISNVARDPRFTSDNLMAEINRAADLSLLDSMLYRYLLIPFTKKALLEQADRFEWMSREGMPPWSRGRDDPMNLTKYFMLEMEEDNTYGAADMPSIWNLKKYKEEEGMRMNWDGATYNARSVMLDSALGIVVEPSDDFMQHMDWLEEFLHNYPPPKYPFEINQTLADAGSSVFDANCAACHNSERTGKPMPVEEVGTDRNRLDSWNKEAAIAANKTVAEMGVERKGMVEEDLIGYVAVHLDGIWLRAPYLHNGSVPTLRDLLKPPAERPTLFYRGYDVYDKINVGFVIEGEEAERIGSRFDTNAWGNGNQGHEYGTALSQSDKNALIEYLKTL